MCGSCGGSGGGSQGMTSSACNPCMCPPPCYPRCPPCCGSSGGKIPRVCPPPCCSQPITLNAIICSDPYECSPCPMRVPLHICGFASKPGGGCC